MIGAKIEKIIYDKKKRPVKIILDNEIELSSMFNYDDEVWFEVKEIKNER